MLYVFTGSDTAKAKAEVRTRAKDAELLVFGEGGNPFEQAPSYITAQGLFAPKVALLLDRPLETAEGKKLLEASAKELHAAEVPVFVIAPKLSATEKKVFPKGTTFETFEAKAQPVGRLSVFGIADLFLSGDRKKTWIEYQNLIRQGIPPEEIHGILSWGVRSALVAMKTKSATESGLKPFVYTKSKRAAEKLGGEKVERYSRELVRVYHQARSGEGTMELNLEMLLLSH